MPRTPALLGLVGLLAALPLFTACAAHPAASPASLGSLSTEAERSHFLRTGRYAEVERLCRGFE